MTLVSYIGVLNEELWSISIQDLRRSIGSLTHRHGGGVGMQESRQR